MRFYEFQNEKQISSFCCGMIIFNFINIESPCRLYFGKVLMGIFSILIDVRRPILIVGRNIPLARQYKWGKWAFYILQYVNFFLILDSDIMWPATCVFPSWWMIPWIVSWIKSFLPSIMFFRYFYHSIRKIYLGNTH